MTDGRHNDPRGGHESRKEKRSALANEHRLLALGEAVDSKSGVTRKVRTRGEHRTRRNVIIGLVVVFALIASVVGGGYLYAQYRFGTIPKIHVAGELPQLSGQPFNILEIGSDSRAGLTGAVAAQTGASTGSVSGQRSDVVKIMHVDPAAGTISVLSIPRDTLVTLLANQSTYGRFNRINVNFGSGPSLLAQTITANFGIPISHTIVVSFSGLINAAVALGGVYLDFPYPAKDAFSNLNITHAGCQLVTGAQALAVARSRHYEWFENGVWNYDVTSDYGRIDRQNAFMRAMIARAKRLYNPLTINSFLSKLPQGITLDDAFTLDELIALVVKFHGINPASMLTYTLPTAPGQSAIGDVLYVSQPAAQQMLVNVFGKGLLTPTNPPPDPAGQTPMPPVVTTTTTAPPSKVTTTSTKKHSATTTAPVTTTTIATPGQQFFDPVPCTP